MDSMKHFFLNKVKVYCKIKVGSHQQKQGGIPPEYLIYIVYDIHAGTFLRDHSLSSICVSGDR